MRTSPWLSCGLFALMISACTDFSPSKDPSKLAPDLKATTPPHWLNWRQEERNNDFVAMAISGGGVKSATFAGEAMFYLDWAGLLRKVNLISSVSGGGFVPARYVLSCDRKDWDAVGEAHNKCFTDGMLRRPIWDYHESMEDDDPKGAGTNAVGVLTRPIGVIRSQVLEAGIFQGLWSWKRKGFTNLINERYLQPKDDPNLTNFQPFRYLLGDLEHKGRPRLSLNATLVSGGRERIEHSDDLGYVRRRRPEEYFHFAFTPYYLGRIGTDYTKMPVEYGVGASAAFPLAVEYFTLTDYRGCELRKNTKKTENDQLNDKDKKDCETRVEQLGLMDGGVNDNQGLMEIDHTIAELMLDEARSDLSSAQPPKDHCKTGDLQCIEPGDKALILSINSAVTTDTGPVGATLGGVVFFRNGNRGLRASEISSSTMMDLRERHYWQSLDSANEKARTCHWPSKPLTAKEIGLRTLNRYREGGLAASVVEGSFSTTGPNQICDDKNACDFVATTRIQRQAYDHISAPKSRERLLLGDVHPQCLFEQARVVDDDGFAGLYEIEPKASHCLRRAARWATALRMQELCMKTNDPWDGHPLNDRAALSCDDQGNFNGGPHSTSDYKKDPYNELRELKECEFTDNDDWNVKILTRLRDNAKFTNELGALELGPLVKRFISITNEDIEEIPRSGRLGMLKEVCNLNNHVESRD